jgi:diacylglycerol kinase (ATP)
VRTCIIINPVAGSAGDLATLPERLGVLPGARVLLTTQSGDAERLAREHLQEGFDRFVAAGGDGTVNAVLNALAPALGAVELGILALGTGNDFAASIGMRVPLEEAISALERWETRPVDVVRVTARPNGADGPVERLMLNGSAGGFVQAVGASTDQGSKRGILGPMSYVLNALASVPELEAYSLRIRADSDEASLRAFATVATNGRTLGGAVPVNPEGFVDDGIMEVMAITEVPVPELALLAVTIMAGGHQESPALRFLRGSQVEIASDPPMPVNADGEEIGTTPVRYQVLPRALRVVVGPSPAAFTPSELSGAGARNAR